MTAATPNPNDGAPNCWQCRHFAVSWDPSFPYTCRLMGFKSRIMPAIEVLRADGSRCRGFMQKPAPPGAPASPAATSAQTPLRKTA